MKELETSFGSMGHYFAQIWRGGDVAVYERSLGPDHPAHELEVIIIKVKLESKTPTGSLVPLRERLSKRLSMGNPWLEFPGPVS